MRDTAKQVSGAPRAALAKAALATAALCLALAPAASADYEQVPEHFGVSGEAEQLNLSKAIAVNVDGVGGVEAGSVYVVGRNNRVLRFSHGAEGEEPQFLEAWGWGIAEDGPSDEFVRCGPAWAAEPRPANSFPTCKPAPSIGQGAPGGEEVGHFQNLAGVAVNQATGDVYVLNSAGPENLSRVHHLIEVFTPTGAPVGEGFGDAGRSTPLTSAESITEGPENLHNQTFGEEDGIAVDEAGTAYVIDRDYSTVPEGSQQARAMSFEPASPGDYEHYVYAGQGKDITVSYANWFRRIALIGSDRLVAGSKQQINEYPTGGGSTPICSFEVSGGVLAALTANPLNGEVFLFTQSSRVVRRLGPCDEATGKFEEVQAPVKPAPETNKMWGLAFNPGLSWGPLRPAGVLYGTDAEEHGTVEPKQRGIGDVFAPAEGAGKPLSVSRGGGGAGTVTSSPAGSSCGATCSVEFLEGSTVTLTATAAEGSTFSTWSGECASVSGEECEVTMSAARAVTATFEPEGGGTPEHKLTVNVSGEGEVSADSGPISHCTSAGGAACEATYPEGNVVTLTETPAEGSEFSGWGTPQCDESTEPTCEITIGSGDEAVAASFEPKPTPEYALKTHVEGEGTIECAPPGGGCASEREYLQGTTVTLTASPSLGWEFKEWTGACAGTLLSVCEVTIEAETEVGAVFAQIPKPKFKLTVSKLGGGTGTITSTPAGINCGTGAGCEAEFEEGVEVELHQVAASGSEFKEWSGACSGSGACEVTMSEAKSVGAIFNLVPRTLSIAKAGTGTDEVKCKANGGSAEPCAASYPNGTSLKLEATANPGSSFAGFSSDTGSASSCTTSPCSFTIEANSTLTATFNVIVKPKFKLTVSKTGTGSGTVTSTPAGINCGSGAGCEAEFEEGVEVELHQSASSGSEFKEWTGACSGSGACKVTMGAAKSVGAVFNLKPKPKFKLSVAKAGTGSGTVTSTPAGIDCGATCEAEFEEGTEVTLSQAASPGSEFKEWSGACSGSGTCKVTMSSAKNVGARFNPAPKPKFKLSVSKTGGGTGTIASSPTGIDCGSTCEHEYEEGTHVVLTESPGAGSEFAGWETPQCDESTATTCEVVIDGDEAVAASFVPMTKPKPEYTLTVEISGSGSGLITCNDTACAASYPEGEEVSFTAVPLAGSSFSGWSGGGCSGTGTCKVTIEEDTTIIAKFSSKPIVTPPPPIEKGTALASGIAQVQNESALIRLLCPGSSRCTGTLELFARLQDQSHGRRRHRDAPKATLIGTASFDLAPRSQGTVSVKIVSQRTLRLLGRGGDLDVQLLGTSVRGRSVRLVGPRVRRHG
jgi:hypothetical protein